MLHVDSGSVVGHCCRLIGVDARVAVIVTERSHDAVVRSRRPGAAPSWAATGAHCGRVEAVTKPVSLASAISFANKSARLCLGFTTARARS